LEIIIRADEFYIIRIYMEIRIVLGNKIIEYSENLLALNSFNFCSSRNKIQNCFRRSFARITSMHTSKYISCYRCWTEGIIIATKPVLMNRLSERVPKWICSGNFYRN